MGNEKEAVAVPMKLGKTPGGNSSSNFLEAHKKKIKPDSLSFFRTSPNSHHIYGCPQSLEEYKAAQGLLISDTEAQDHTQSKNLRLSKLPSQLGAVGRLLILLGDFKTPKPEFNKILLVIKQLMSITQLDAQYLY